MNQIPKKIISVIAQVKTFGAFGEQYKIIEALYPLKNGDWLMKIKLLHNGELIPYRYSEILCDPLACQTEILRTSLR